MKALRIKQVLEKTSLSQSTVYALIAEGKFPKSFPLTANRVAWLESDVDDWLAEKAGRLAPDQVAAGVK
ncbi:AlpA family transcriptional regulator [Burkholderia gladioli]|uniref:AlpA family transcriptional regulator n=1 Tax=Burkholderia gladioli TaxID=28095 RepID=UPI003EE38636